MPCGSCTCPTSTPAASPGSSGRRNTLREEVAMTVRKRRSDRSGRGALPSPGRPSVARREDHRQFWAAIAAGRSSEDAAVEAGVSPAVGARWFRRAGGMPPSHLAPSAKPLSGRSLSFAEREEIAIWRAQRHGVREIARRLARAPSTISRELRRNAATRSGGLAYRATTAQWHADRSARRPKPAKLAINGALRRYVQDRLAGLIIAPNGAAVHGPVVPWKGRRRGRRQDRRWAKAWSPEQIAHRLRLEFPDDETMRISHEAIYQALYVQGRGALRRELTACLRTGRALRVPRARSRGRGKSGIAPEILISQRPAEAEDRAVPGHWEGDLIVGLGSSAIGTLVERTTRFTILLHLPRMAGHGDGPRTKNGPALAGHGAEAVRAHHARDHHLTRTTATIADLGSGSGNGPTRPAPDRGWRGGLLLRSPQSVAARHEREHQRAAAPVLSKGHRPQRAQRRGPGSRGDRPQQQAAKDPGLENTGRGSGPVPPNNSHRPCCDDHLNPPCVRLVSRPVLEGVVPVLLIAVAVYFAVGRRMREEDAHARVSPLVFVGGVAPAIGFYDGMFGPGGGSFYMLGFVSLLGYGVLRATAHTKLANAASGLGSLGVYTATGAVVWPIGLAMALGAILGAQVGSFLAIRLGARLIRPLLVLVCSGLTIRLLLEPTNPLRKAITGVICSVMKAC